MGVSQIQPVRRMIEVGDKWVGDPPDPSIDQGVTRLGPALTSSRTVGDHGPNDVCHLSLHEIGMVDPDTSSNGQAVCRIPLDQIDAGPKTWSLREWVDDAEIDALAETIRANGGVDVPITIRPAGSCSYVLVVGMRRVTAARRAGLQEIDAFVRSVSDTAALLIAIREDASRKDLTTLELGWALLRLRENWPVEVYGPYRQRHLAALVGAAENSISEPIRIAEAVPRDLLIAAGEEYGVAISRLAGLGRKALRPIRAAAVSERLGLIRKAVCAIAEAERDLDRPLDMSNLTNVALSAIRAKRRGRPEEPCTLMTRADGRLELTIRRPLSEWKPEQRQRFIKAIGPLLAEAQDLEGEAGANPSHSLELARTPLASRQVRGRHRRAKVWAKVLVINVIRLLFWRN